jgi:hypothetical protein
MDMSKNFRTYATRIQPRGWGDAMKKPYWSAYYKINKKTTFKNYGYPNHL